MWGRRGGGGVPPSNPDPSPPPTRINPDPPSTGNDIQTAAFGRIPKERYDQERDRIARGHENNRAYSIQWTLGTVKTAQAWADVELRHGPGAEPGAGVTVGLIDTGIDRGHPAFAGKVITEDFLGTVDETGTRADTGRFSHGTAVASVIAGRPTPGFPGEHTGKINGGFFGVAPGADLKMFAIRLRRADPDRTYAPTAPGSLGRVDTYWAGVFNTALGEHVDILNLSFGVSGIIESYRDRAADLRSNFRRTIAALEQRGRAEKTILVWAAGNANGQLCTPGAANCVGGRIDASSVEVFPGLPVLIAELRGHSIAVVAVDRSGEIADYSNRCGTAAADWCLAAPGGPRDDPDDPDDPDDTKFIWGAFFGPDDRGGIEVPARGYIRVAGTSYAAPMVAGGLAVMKQFFRDQLSNTELVTRLFATANRVGEYAKRSIYGQGLMDLAAATYPVGNTMVAGGATVSDGGVDLRLTSLRLGGAFGDALGASLAGQELAAFDALGAPFWFRLTDMTGNTPVPSSLLRLHELMDEDPIRQWVGGQLTTLRPGHAGGAVERDFGYGRLRLGFLETPTGVEGGHFVLARHATTLTLTGANGMAATAFTTSGAAGRAPTSGAALSWRPFDAPVGFRAGWLNERGTLLGTAAAGAFGSLSADAAFAGVETGFAVGTWRLSADAELGTAIPRLRGGMMTRMSSLTTSAFALHATRRLTNGGSVRVSVSQPLRVEAGRAALSVPIGRTKSGAVLRSSLAADLTPSGRQMNVSAYWRHPLADLGELRVAATWMRHPGHSADAAPGLRLLAGWRFAF